MLSVLLGKASCACCKLLQQPFLAYRGADRAALHVQPKSLLQGPWLGFPQHWPNDGLPCHRALLLHIKGALIACACRMEGKAPCTRHPNRL